VAIDDEGGYNGDCERGVWRWWERRNTHTVEKKKRGCVVLTKLPLF